MRRAPDGRVSTESHEHAAAVSQSEAFKTKGSMRILVFGGSGIIGQHMQERIPSGVTAAFPAHEACDLTDKERVCDVLSTFRPQAIVNLAGESRPDVVERAPYAHHAINVGAAYGLVRWCDRNHVQFVQVSTQAVFNGEEPPYGLNAACEPINEYGKQKRMAENLVLYYPCATVIRPTFVLGIRPNPNVGRPNPIELMLEGQRKQVNDRWFSPSFAPDVARCIWESALERPFSRVIHCGVPIRTNRYEIALALGLNPEPVSHSDFPGIAPRPRDTTYAEGAVHWMSFEQGLRDCLARDQKRIAA